jgi:hypothetical protein
MHFLKVILPLTLRHDAKDVFFSMQPQLSWIGFSHPALNRLLKR